jgi:hypothetical protein
VFRLHIIAHPIAIATTTGGDPKTLHAAKQDDRSPQCTVSSMKSPTYDAWAAGTEDEHAVRQ